MRTRVIATATRSGVLLRLTQLQRQLIRETLMFHASHSDGDISSIVRLGIDRANTKRLMEKVAEPNPEFQLGEVHALLAALASAPVMIPSQEAFYIRIGFFQENVLALAGGLIKAIEEMSDSAVDPSEGA
ncbi:hypothetical protein [Streptomyces sudanensis]|uniref:hypothetical protein n=1 Tax=Streptomyces sudanensis TaxID=436397 RepID=UPI0020CE8BE5|nr:hypothetical protein [Streptomyces sudanensis]MCP9957584.1 hypothetical protein [Streptomyces sudanensis]MCQ0001876.1 hypothetical protein [Streptomyces sudanensis]